MEVSALYVSISPWQVLCSRKLNTKLMNLKRTFGTILTILGIVGLIYAAVGFAQDSKMARELIVFAVLGVIFFFTGIGLVKNTRDVAKM